MIEHVTVHIDEAGRDVLALRVDMLVTHFEVSANGFNEPVADRDVGATEGLRCGVIDLAADNRMRDMVLGLRSR